MSGATAGARMGKTKEEGQQLLDSFFSGFPKVKQAIEDSKKSLKEKGYVEDWAGRRRHLPDYFLPPYEAKYKDKEKADNMSFNPILGCKDRPPIDAKLKSYLDQAQLCRGNKQFDELAKQAYKDGVILTTNTGRIAQAERQCFNARIQGGASSLTKLAMVNIYNSQAMKDLQAKLIITVHDELLVECPDFYSEQVAELLPQIMIETAKPYIKVPMSCDPANESRWYISEVAAHIAEEYSSALNKQNLSHEEAKQSVLQSHPELTEAAINMFISGAEDMPYEVFNSKEITTIQSPVNIIPAVDRELDLDKSLVDDLLDLEDIEDEDNESEE